MLLRILALIVGGANAHPGHSHGPADAASHSINSFFSDYLFPYSARYNALLATIYISIAPCVIVTAIPQFRRATEGRLLSLMMAFAFGTLMGDIILHLLPEIFGGSVDKSQDLQWTKFLDDLPLQDSTNDHIRDVLSMLKPQLTGSNHPSQLKTMTLGFLVFCGFLGFVVIDKGMKISSFGTTGGLVHSHHGHSHSLQVPAEQEDESLEILKSSEVSVDVDSQELKHRAKKEGAKLSKSSPAKEKTPSSSLKTSAYLSLVSAFVHNITDGVALASAFYKSKPTGVVTTFAVLVHEIPHELGDFAILLASGISFPQALQLQAFGAIGALIGTLCGCLANEMASKTPSPLFNGQTIPEIGVPIFDSSNHSGWPISAGEVMLPITAGGLLFISTIGVVPELLKTTAKTGKKELINSTLQLLCVLAGFALMAWMGMD